MDKNRASIYFFSNKDFLMKFPFYLQEEVDPSDDPSEIGNVDMYRCDDNVVEPTGYCMKLSGGASGTKANKKTNVIIVSHAKTFVDRFRELKDLKIGSFDTLGSLDLIMKNKF